VGAERIRNFVRNRKEINGVTDHYHFADTGAGRRRRLLRLLTMGNGRGTGNRRYRDSDRGRPLFARGYTLVFQISSTYRRGVCHGRTLFVAPNLRSGGCAKGLV
jgi:hypothetical protein